MDRSNYHLSRVSKVVPVVKDLHASAGDAGDVGLSPGSGRSLGEGNGNPLQCFCLGNPMDRGAYHRVIRVGHDLAPNHHHHCEVETIARTFLWKVNPVTKTLLRLHGANKCQSQDVNPSSLIPESTLLITILAVSLSKHTATANQNGSLLQKMM